MTGTTDLNDLLRSIRPVLHDGEFVFCAVSFEDRQSFDANAVCEFKEDEGVTLIMRRHEAERLKLNFTYICRMITLNVYSSLDTVGFLAAVTAKLAGHGISVNPVSAFYHDHLFVPVDKAEQAMKILEEFG
jgi:hypothetical protein